MIDSAKSKWGQRGRTVRDRIKKVDLGLVLLIALPLILLSITRLWLFPRLGSGDSWIYFGYFIRPVQFLNAKCYPLLTKEFVYSDSRLPWTMAGALVYHLFPPLVANYVLHLSFYYATVLSVYGTLKCTVGKRSGLLAAILLGTYGYFMVSQNWDYVEVAVLAYFSLAIFLLTLAAKLERWRLALFAAGCFCGAMVYSNITSVGLTPALTIYYLLSNHRYRRNPILPSISYSILGLMGVTLFFGLINYAINGNLFFFMPAINYAKVAGPHSQGSIVEPGWSISLNEHRWIWLPFLLACTSLICIVLSYLKSRRDRALAECLPIFSVTFLLCLLPHVFLEIRGLGVIRLPYYASYLMPSTFLALGEQISPMLDRLNRRATSGLIAVIVILQIFIFRQLLYRMVAQGFSHSAALADIEPLMQGIATLVFTVIVVLLLLRLISSRANAAKKLRHWVTLRLILMVTVLGFYYCFNFQALFTLFGSDNGAWSRLFYSSIPEDSMLAVVQAHNILREVDPEGELVFGVEQANLPVSSTIVLSTISSSSLAPTRLISSKFPQLDYYAKPRINQVKLHCDKLPKLLILSQKTDVVQQANTSLASIGFTSKLVSSYDIAQGDIHFRMSIVEISEKPSRKVD